MAHGIEGALNEDMIDLGQETQRTIDLLSQTPASALGSCRHKLSDDDYQRLLKIFKTHNIRHFVYIGGNDSMDTCHRISVLAEQSNYDMQVMGVPKTIDNDLAYTDHTPGFGSAARFVALAARDTGRDLESMETFDDVSILETMGRNAGWLTAAAVLGKVEDHEAPDHEEQERAGDREAVEPARRAQARPIRGDHAPETLAAAGPPGRACGSTATATSGARARPRSISVSPANAAENA